MNVANILAVADAIETESVCHFNMITYGDDLGCGTAACIAGTAVILESGKSEIPDSGYHFNKWLDYIYEVPERAEKFLGVDHDTGNRLFVPWDCVPAMADVPAKHITPAWAARTLRNLAITGNVDWQGSKAENDPTLPEVPEREIVKSELKESV